MIKDIELVAKAWNNREGPAVLATVDASKKPNAIYVGEGFIVADNYFCKTLANIENGAPGAIKLRWTKGKTGK
jgi:hypothetical protein